MKRLTTLFLGIIMVLSGYGFAYAFGSYLTTAGTGFNSVYPSAGAISVCGLCHTNPAGGGARNTYGTAFANAGHVYAAIENLDSDGDGFTNIAEITNVPPTFPGDAASHPAPVAVTCTSFTYSAFSACQPDNTQTRTVTSSSPTGCTGGNPVLTQSCTYVPPSANTCTSFTYSAFSACQPDNTQTRTVTSSSPSGCTGGNPVLTQSCTYVQPPGGDTSVTINAATGTGQIKIETMTGGTNLTNVSVISSSDASVNQSGKPSGFTFNDGLVSFKLNGVATGGTAQVKVTFPSDFASGSKVYKVRSDGFHEYTNSAIAGKSVTLTLTDGGNGDSDGTANGSITDPVGVASPVAVVHEDDDDRFGCSIGSRRSSATAFADSAVLLLPLIVIGALRLRRRKK